MHTGLFVQENTSLTSLPMKTYLNIWAFSHMGTRKKACTTADTAAWNSPWVYRFLCIHLEDLWSHPRALPFLIPWAADFCALQGRAMRESPGWRFWATIKPSRLRGSPCGARAGPASSDPGGTAEVYVFKYTLCTYFTVSPSIFIFWGFGCASLLFEGLYWLLLKQFGGSSILHACEEASAGAAGQSPGPSRAAAGTGSGGGLNRCHPRLRKTPSGRLLHLLCWQEAGFAYPSGSMEDIAKFCLAIILFFFSYYLSRLVKTLLKDWTWFFVFPTGSTSPFSPFATNHYFFPLSPKELKLMGLFQCMSNEYSSITRLPGNGAYQKKKKKKLL